MLVELKSQLFDTLSALHKPECSGDLIRCFLDGLNRIAAPLHFSAELTKAAAVYMDLFIDGETIPVGVSGPLDSISAQDREVLDDVFNMAGRIITGIRKATPDGDGSNDSHLVHTQRDRIIKALLHINERNVLIGKLVEIGFWDYNLENGAMTWSESLFKLLGRSPESSAPSLRNALRALHPEDRPKIEAKMREQVRAGGRLEFDSRVLLPDGSYRWVLVAGAMFSAAWKQGPPQMMGVVMDITGRKQAEQDLVREEQKYRQLVNNANEWILVSQNGMIRFSNPMSRQILGYMPEEMVGTPFGKYIHPDDLQLVTKNHIKRQAGNFVPRYMFRVIDKNGVMHWLETSGVPCEWEGSAAALVFLSDVTERRVTEQALMRSEERVNLVLEATQDCIFDWNLAQDRFYISPRLPRMLGYNPEEFPSTRNFLMNLVHQEDRPLLETTLEHHLDGRLAAVHMECRIQRKDGGWSWTLMRCKAVRHGPNGQPERIVGAITDISERWYAQKGLRDFGQMFSASPVLMALLDKNYCYKYANPSYQQAFGLESEGLIGRHAKDVIGGELFEALSREGVAKCLNGETIQFNQWIKYPGLPDERFSSVMYYPHRNRVGEIEGVVVYRSDMTKLKQAEDSLRTSEWMLTNLVRDLGIILYSADADGIIDYAAGRGLEEIGLTTETMVGMSIHDFPPELSAAARRGLAGEAFCVETEQGDKIYNSCFNPIHDDSGNVVGLLGVALNITDQRKAEQALRRAERMESVGTLAGGIAHDFNNILAAIQNLAFLLRMQAPEQGSARNDLDQIIASTDRGKKLVQQILTFSRKSDSRERKPIYPDSLVNETLKLLRASLPANISMTYENEAQDAVIMANPTNIHQVMLNLCTNAADATRETGGEIRIRLRQEERTQDDPELPPGRYVALSVADSGYGVDPSLGDKIFDPFYTSKPLGRGTGLGLSVVHGIMRRHGGVVRYTSEPGKGSEFTAYFPQVDMAAAREEGAAATPRPGAGRILFVDDEVALRDSSQRILEGLGYSVHTAADGQEALELVQTNEFDLVITDMAMPRMTGSQLAQALKRLRPKLPVLLCTGYSDTFGPDDAATAGMAGYLQKPMDWQTVSQLITETIGRSEAHGTHSGD
ncbi:PAS domain S-box protein [Oceanidesulfovibrio marinus]|nr:PAS domain S-box protein [Oceanidesulfovibrio marinus]